MTCELTNKFPPIPIDFHWPGEKGIGYVPFCCWLMFEENANKLGKGLEVLMSTNTPPKKQEASHARLTEDHTKTTICQKQHNPTK